MSFDQDPGEQAQISGADFALMCNEMNRLKAANAELVEVLQAIELPLGVLRIPAAEVLDENSPIRDALRAALAQHDKETS